MGTRCRRCQPGSGPARAARALAGPAAPSLIRCLGDPLAPRATKTETQNCQHARAKRPIRISFSPQKIERIPRRYSRPLHQERQLAPQVPGLRAREGLDAVRPQVTHDPGTPHAGPRQPRADAVAAVPVHRARMHLSANLPRSFFVGRVDAGGKPGTRCRSSRCDRLRRRRRLLNADDRAEALRPSSAPCDDRHRRIPSARTSCPSPLMPPAAGEQRGAPCAWRPRPVGAKLRAEAGG